ncbi:MAG: hypothetical protein IPK94_08590 [Saprospiraceae bacterium]|nr:hypothetical protein [Saprospiraceae bacterium]
MASSRIQSGKSKESIQPAEFSTTNRTLKFPTSGKNNDPVNPLITFGTGVKQSTLLK